MGRKVSCDRPSLQVRLLLFVGSALLLLQCAHSAIDNVAVQWNTFLISLICKHGIFFNDANSYYSQMLLAHVACACGFEEHRGLHHAGGTRC
jgi:hypothetical protein